MTTPLRTLQSRGEGIPGPLGTQIARLGPWFHNLHLPDGTSTAPDHPLGDFPANRWQVFSRALPEDLSGWQALDIGCNAGFYSFELARRGASVLGIDLDDHYLAQARWARGLLGLERGVRFERLGVYELPRLDERFDLVLFLGVLYHLRYPLLALEMVAEKVGRLALVQSLSLPPEPEVEIPFDLELSERGRLAATGWPKLAFVERDFAGDPTNWWVPNGACLEAMLRSVGLEPVERLDPESLLCQVASPRRPQRYREQLPLARG